MNVNGERTFDAPRAIVWTVLNDPAAMAEGIRAFYGRDPAVLGRAARARAEREYGWDSAMHGLLGLYRGALDSACSRGPRYAMP